MAQGSYGGLDENGPDRLMSRVGNVCSYWRRCVTGGGFCKANCRGAREMDQQSIALTEDLGLIPSTHLQLSKVPVPGDSTGTHVVVHIHA